MSEIPLMLFESVSKWYGTVLVLNQVTLELRGGITGLVGSNGAGKSTLMKIATGQIKPTLGKASIMGIDAWHWTARRMVGFCPDVDAFYEDRSGRDFVREMARLDGFSKADVKDRTDQVLLQVGMSDRSHRKIRGYSKGMRQRIKLAQALLTKPKLLILDEPMSGIDPVGRQEMIDLFRLLSEDGTGILISSHELEELGKLTNHVVVMARGRVAAVGTLSEIRDRMNDFPLSIQIDAKDVRNLATRLLSLPMLTGIELKSVDSLIVRTEQPRQFFSSFHQLIINERIAIDQIMPLDESAHAVLGYVLGGQGKT